MRTEIEARTMNRGLLTKAQREFLQGDKPDVDQDNYLYRIRSDFRARMDELEEDLEILREADQNELVEEFFDRFGRVERLEREIEELRKKVEDE